MCIRTTPAMVTRLWTECHGICQLDAACVLQSRRVKVNVYQTQVSRHHSSRRNCHGNVPTDAARQGTLRPDEECQGICLRNAKCQGK